MIISAFFRGGGQIGGGKKREERQENNALMPDDGADHSRPRSSHDSFRQFFHRRRHRRAKHPLPHLNFFSSSSSELLAAALAGGEDLVRLFEKVELEQLVGFVEDQVLRRRERDEVRLEGKDESERGRDQDVCVCFFRSSPRARQFWWAGPLNQNQRGGWW